MNSHIKTLSVISGALLFSGVIYSLQGCHKEPPIGNDDATVVNKNSNSSPQPASVPMAEPMATTTPEVIVAASPAPSKEKSVAAAKRAYETPRAAKKLPAAKPPIEASVEANRSEPKVGRIKP